MGRVAEFEGVGLRYGPGAEVLQDLDFSLSRGGFYVLTGASGAGKTTLLRMLYLAQTPTRGSLRVLGEDVTRLSRAALPALRRRIGVVFQDFRLIPHLSARDNVALPLRLAGHDERRIRAEVDELLDWVGLGRRAEGKPPALSGGEQQRVAIARAVVVRPELLIADEPTGNVDPELAERLLGLFTALNAQGTTVLIATHDARLAARVPHARTMRLERGRLSDPTGALRHPPQPALVP